MFPKMICLNLGKIMTDIHSLWPVLQNISLTEKITNAMRET